MTVPATTLWDAWRQRREGDAFEALVRPWLPALLDLARRESPRHAEDAVQDALLDLARRHDARPAEVGIAPWLFRSVRLRLRTLERGAARRTRHEGVAAARREGRPAHPPAGDGEGIERALAGLPPDDRLVLLLRHVYDLEYREVAAILGVTENACRVRVHRATARLRASLGANAPVLLAALPLRAPPEGARWIAAATHGAPKPGGLLAATGGIGMGTLTKTAAVAGAALLLALGAWWGLDAAGRYRASDEQGGGLSPRADSTSPPPTLVGSAHPAGGAGAVLPPPGTPSRTNDGTPPEGERSGLAEAGEALLAAIRRNAAPDFWADPPGDATLAQRNGVVIARASSDVHDAIGEYLEERRHAALDAALPTGPSPDRTSTEEETRAAVRALRAGAGDLLRRDRELGAIVRALLGDDPEQATSLLDAYLVREPESELAASWKEALLEHPERATSIGVAAREVQARWRRATRVDEWLWQVPAPRAFASIAGPLDRLGRDRLRCRGDALRELLERGSITVETEHASVYEILREIQIQTFVQIVYRPADAWNLDRRTVPRFSVVGRTLREVMDRVVETAAPDQDLTWTANPRCLVLRPAGDQAPPMLLRFYDVRDLLADPQHPASGTEPSAAGPPIPPTYVASEDGEPVLLTPRETEVERERAAAAAIDASAPSASGR